MALTFLNLQQVLLTLKVERVGTPYGSYAVYDDKDFAKKLRQKRLWIALDDNNQLRVSDALLNCGNDWLDTVARMKDNQPEKFQELISC